MLTELREGWHAFHSRTWLFLSVLSLTLIITVVFAPLYVLGPKVALEHLGGAGAWAAINTSIGIGAMVGGAIGLRWKPRFPLRAGFVLTLVGEPAMLFLLALGGPLAGLIGFALFAGIGGSLFNVFWFTVVQREVPAGELSRVSSWDHLGTYALTPLGLALVGPIAAGIGISATLYSAAALALLLTLCVLATPAVRNFESVPVPTEVESPGAT
jgi:MFS family permease